MLKGLLALAPGVAVLAVASASAAGPAFVGAARCAGCHPGQAAAYRSSDHARAMLPATEAAVQGDFGGARFRHRGLASTFFRRDGRFYVRTEGPDGQSGDFAVAYTFGVRPLQQYLVPFPDGRLQALGIAWDTRDRRAGGQRWFALYPRERFAPGDPLHWTGREQTWNFQCADCHSTDLQKNYDAVSDRYTTSWAEVTVACEACHGPGSAHVAWAESRPASARGAGAGTTGLVVRLGRPDGRWVVRNPRGTAEWRGIPRTASEVDACARCHARRRAIVDPYAYGRPLLDTHVPALLQEGLYHADGQILAEVYEYGSFVQSRMFRAGVTCSDCHEPHGLALRAPGNGVCTACHLAARFDRPAHHRHRAGSEAARCVACHMPARTYMVVDSRRDHAFPVPRPDLSAALGTPNPCSGCHRDRSTRWAAARMAAWYGPRASRRAHFAKALHAGRRGGPGAEAALVELATDARQPAIARASALALLPDYLGPRSLPALEAAVADPDPLVRTAGLGVVETLAVERRPALAASRLRDPVRAVRLAAARALLGTPAAALGPDQWAAFDGALGELLASERLDADRPEAHLNLATLYGRLGRPRDAEASLQAALRLDPRFVPALLALAELWRGDGRDADGAPLVEQAAATAPASAETLEALGRLRLRQGRRDEGLSLLRRAAALAPGAARYAYLYALALHTAGKRAEAIGVLERAHRRWPGHRDVLAALAAAQRDAGNPAAALRYAKRLATLAPDDDEVRTLVETLRRRTGAR